MADWQCSRTVATRAWTRNASPLADGQVARGDAKHDEYPKVGGPRRRGTQKGTPPNLRSFLALVPAAWIFASIPTVVGEIGLGLRQWNPNRGSAMGIATAPIS